MAMVVVPGISLPGQGIEAVAASRRVAAVRKGWVMALGAVRFLHRAQSLAMMAGDPLGVVRRLRHGRSRALGCQKTGGRQKGQAKNALHGITSIMERERRRLRATPPPKG